MSAKKAEDNVSRFINGGHCTETLHVPASHLEMLLMLKHLRLALPHQSTNVPDIEHAIRTEVKKLETK